MEAFRKGDIVIFPFPYTDLTNHKIRPCLVLSDEMRKDLILCQITSKNIQDDEFCVELEKDEPNEGTLAIDSYIRTNMLFTAAKFQIIKKICSLTDEKYEKVIRKINQIISK